MTARPSRAQQLIALADQVAAAPDPSPRWGRWVAIVVAVLVAIALVTVLVVVALGDDDDAPPASDAAPTTRSSSDTPAPVATTAPAATTAPESAPATTVAPEAVPSDTATPGTATPGTATPGTATPDTAALESTATTVTTEFPDPVRWAEFSDGVVTLSGIVPDQATADEIRAAAAAVVGEQNVVVQYTIVPGAPRPSSAPLYVRDSVLFDRDSVEIDDAARAVLDLGVLLMQQNPQITIDIEGHTDADGSDAMNQALSQRRVDVIYAYLLSQGVDPARLTTAAFGETQPIADNTTPEGKVKNRRVEFTINNLLG
jgi:outer membrane protein OmpA-like peptidoglycan-associated protein